VSKLRSIIIAGAILAFCAPPGARASLISVPANSVDVFFYLGNQTPANTEEETVGPTAIGPGGLAIPAHALDLSDILVGNTTITITGESSLPFCSTGSPCTDSFTGFEFKFSSGANISGVTVDPASAVTLLPVSPITFSPTDILVNLTGDASNVGDSLILDLTFSNSVSTTPLPAALPLFAAGLGALGLLAQRRKRKTTIAA
jgi:hypothetical protein